MKKKLEEKYKQLNENIISNSTNFDKYFNNKLIFKLPNDFSYYQSYSLRSTIIRGKYKLIYNRNAPEFSFFIISTHIGSLNFYSNNGILLNEYSFDIDIYGFEISIGRPPVIVLYNNKGLFKIYTIGIFYQKKLVIGNRMLIDKLTSFFRAKGEDYIPLRPSKTNDLSIILYHIRDVLLPINYPFNIDLSNTYGEDLDIIVFQNNSILFYNPEQENKGNITVNSTITSFEKLGGRIAFSYLNEIKFLYLSQKILLNNTCNVNNGTIISIRFDSQKMGYLYATTDNGYLYLFHFYSLLITESRCEIIKIINIKDNYKVLLKYILDCNISKSYIIIIK